MWPGRASGSGSRSQTPEGPAAGRMGYSDRHPGHAPSAVLRPCPGLAQPGHAAWGRETSPGAGPWHRPAVTQVPVSSDLLGGIGHGDLPVVRPGGGSTRGRKQQCAQQGDRSGASECSGSRVGLLVKGGAARMDLRRAGFEGPVTSPQQGSGGCTPDSGPHRQALPEKAQD